MPMRGGPRLEPMVLRARMFGAAAMRTSGAAPLERMKLPGLKEELKVRGERHSGVKHVLQRRLHGLLVQAAIQAAIRRKEQKRLHWEIFGKDSSEDDSRDSSGDSSSGDSGSGDSGGDSSSDS